MNLSSINKDIILKEFTYVLPKIKETKDLSKKLYFLSALHGVVRRIMNIEFNESLIFLHHVLQATHAAFAIRLNAMVNKAEKPVEITDDMVDRLFSLVDELYSCIDDDQDFCHILRKMTVLSYVTTGNGYYLYCKGVLRID
ncbi:MAG: hypothetical protein KAU17_06775 [Spirochaetales bacterium]|nr:hypothetical protein [Spirochaetales bacterium]